MFSKKLIQSGTFFSILMMAPAAGFALPQGGVIASGSATIDNSVAHQTTINQSSSKAIIDWNSFNISTGETTTFNQQAGASSVALNRIHDQDPTRIFGNLNANGTIMLVNNNGILFGPTAKVDVGGMIATTSNISNNDFNNGNYNFSAATNRPNATITNDGKITAANGGIVALVAPNVVNNGIINAKLGKVSLAGGQAFTLDLMGDGLVNLQVPAKSGKVTQSSTGQIFADGGTVQLSAKDAAGVVDSVINMSGIVQAETANSKDGHITLDASNATMNLANNGNVTKNLELKNTNLDVQTGIDTVDAAGTVKLDAGTYSVKNGATLQVNKSVTINGAGAGNTTIDTSTVHNGGFGIHMTADNSTLSNVTVKGSSNDQNAIKIEGNSTTKVKSNNITLSSVKVNGSSKSAEIDINGSDNATLTNVSVNGNGSAGVGIAITDSNGTSMKNITTTGDAWGGIALQANGNTYAGGIHGVHLTGTNSFGEDVAMYTEALHGKTIDAVAAKDMTFEIQSNGLSAAGQTRYATNQAAAIRDGLAVVALGDASTVVQGMDTTTKYLTGNNTYWVGRDVNTQLSLDSAFNAVRDNGTVNVLAGNYTFNNTLYVTKNGVKIQGSGRDNTTLDGSTNFTQDSYGILVNGDNDTLQGFTLKGSTAGSYGIKIEPNTLASANPAADDSDHHMENPAYNDTVNGTTLFDLRVTGFGKNEIDLNSARGALINDVIADGAGTAGYGIAMTDSKNITLNDVTTLNNGWGGVYIDARGKYYAGGSDNIGFFGTDTFNEANQLETQNENGYAVTHIYAPMFKYVAQAGTALGHSFYQTNLNPAIALAVGLDPATSTVEGLKLSGIYTVGNNTYYVGQNGGQQMRIQTALDAADTGGTVNVLAGTYDLSTSPNGYLYITKGVTLDGAGQGQTFLDGSNNSTYGIRVQADNTLLENFTLTGPAKQAAGSSQEYGIKAELGANTGNSIDNLIFNNLTVKNAGKTQIDINTGDTIAFNNVTVKGNGTRGAGLFLTDDSNVLFNNVTTNNNAWGGIALSANQQDMSNFLFLGNNKYQNESIQMYTEGANGHSVNNIYAPEFKYLTAVNGVAGYGAYYTALTPAIAQSLALSTANGTVQGLKTPFLGFTRGTNTYYVGEQGINEMSIQAAINAMNAGGTVNVLAGTYNLSTYPFGYLRMDKAGTINGTGQGTTTLDGSNNSTYGIRVLADNVTLQNFTLDGPAKQAAASSQEYGVKAEVVDPALSGPTIDNFTMNNVTVQGAGKTQIDVNHATFAAFNNVTAKGNGIRGNGFGITDGYDVTFNNVTTSNNGWGGIRISADGDAATGKIRLNGTDHLNEANPFYTESTNGAQITDMYLPQFGYGVSSQAFDDLGTATVWYKFSSDQTGALAEATRLINSGDTDAVIQGQALDSAFHIQGTNRYLVGLNMSLQAAVDAARTNGTLRLLNGTYDLTTALNLNGKSISLIGTGTQPPADGGTLIDASTLDSAFGNDGTHSTSQLTISLRQPGQGGNGGDGGDAGLATRETTRPNSPFTSGGNNVTGGSAGAGTANALDLIEPAAGPEDKKKTAKKDKGIEQMPLTQEELAVIQYFINTGKVVDQNNALQALLLQAAAGK